VLGVEGKVAGINYNLLVIVKTMEHVMCRIPAWFQMFFWKTLAMLSVQAFAEEPIRGLSTMGCAIGGDAK